MDPKSKKGVISAIGCSWKNFKGELTRSCVKPFKDDPGNLWNRPEKFKKFIDQEDWDAFVRGRLSPKFEVYIKFILLYKCNIYPRYG